MNKNNLEKIDSQAIYLTEYSNWTKLRWSNAKMHEISADLAGKLVMMMGLGGETGEISEALERHWSEPSESTRGLLIKELGDAMFYWFRLSDSMEADPVRMFIEAVASMDSVLIEGDVSPDVARQQIKLTAAAGHVLEVGKKFVRDDHLNQDKLMHGLQTYVRAWLRLAQLLGFNFQDVLQTNREKIECRFSRGVVSGNGDDR